MALPVYRGTTCLSRHHLSIAALPVYHGTTCLSWHYLSIMALPIYHSTTCLSRHYLFITALPVYHGTTYLSQHYLSLTALPVYHGTTCLSRHYLSITALPVYHGTTSLSRHYLFSNFLNATSGHAATCTAQCADVQRNWHTKIQATPLTCRRKWSSRELKHSDRIRSQTKAETVMYLLGQSVTDSHCSLYGYDTV